MDPEKIAKSVDRVQLNENIKKLEEYCLQNPDTPVMQAFEKLAGESK